MLSPPPDPRSTTTSKKDLLVTRTSYQILSFYYDSRVKTYGQRCPLARALDVVGDRWTLLVVRELMLGPRRYTDLTDGLPGVGTNILAAKLADLQRADLVVKRELPPPTAVTVYELTEAGRALGPSLGALSEWGERYGAPITDSQAVRPQWILTSMARRNTDLLAARSCELRVGRNVFELDGDGSMLSITTGTARSPDAIIALEPDVFYALATKRIAPREARERAVIDGDHAVATQLLNAISGAAANYRPPASVAPATSARGNRIT
jgi:DNA-binding HxlR family transcriptional regulator